MKLLHLRINLKTSGDNRNCSKVFNYNNANNISEKIALILLPMVYSCSVDRYRSNYPGTAEKVLVFDFRGDNDVSKRSSKRWERYAAGQNRDWCKKSTSKICAKHFEDQYLRRGEGPKGRERLLMILKPVLDSTSR